jgi:hypothetical protein
VFFVLLVSLLVPENIFLNTLAVMFGKDYTIQCSRCGGDGKLSYNEQKVFFQSDILNDEKAIKSFQDWMDEQGEPWIMKNDRYWFIRRGTVHEPMRHLNGDGYGIFGNQTEKVYRKFKYDWWNSLNSNKTQEITCSLCSK